MQEVQEGLVLKPIGCSVLYVLIKQQCRTHCLLQWYYLFVNQIVIFKWAHHIIDHCLSSIYGGTQPFILQSCLRHESCGFESHCLSIRNATFHVPQHTLLGSGKWSAARTMFIKLSSRCLTSNDHNGLVQKLASISPVGQCANLVSLASTHLTTKQLHLLIWHICWLLNTLLF